MADANKKKNKDTETNTSPDNATPVSLVNTPYGVIPMLGTVDDKGNVN